jgi:hypothetical protein
MPAPSIDALLNFEEQFEGAGQTVLATCGVTSFISQEAVQLFANRDIYTGVGLDLGPAIDELAQLPKPEGWPVGQPPPTDYFRYDANFSFRISVKRDQNQSPDPNVDTLFAFVRARIRRAMMMSCGPFNSTNLPWYEVSNIRPNGASWGFESARNIDFTDLRFALRFAILDTAWPPAWT